MISVVRRSLNIVYVTPDFGTILSICMFTGKAEYSADTNVQQDQEQHGDRENDVMLSNITTSDEKTDGTSKPNNNGVQNVIVSDGQDTHDTPTWSHLCNVMDRLFFAFFLLLNLITGLTVFVFVPWSIGFFAKAAEEKENTNE